MAVQRFQDQSLLLMVSRLLLANGCVLNVRLMETTARAMKDN